LNKNEIIRLSKTTYEVITLHVRRFYKSQRELAIILNDIVDRYWNDEINEENFIEILHKLYEDNSQKVMKNDDFTTVLKQQCGKRRLEIVGKIIKEKQMMTILR
jgi:uncharacterized protein (TIGR04540 family)